MSSGVRRNGEDRGLLGELRASRTCAEGGFLRNLSARAEGGRRGATSNSEGGIGKLSVRRVFKCPQIDTGPRRSPSACSEILKKRTAKTGLLGELWASRT